MSQPNQPKSSRRAQWLIVVVATSSVLFGGLAAAASTAKELPTFGSSNAAWANYYANPSNAATWAPYCAGGGGSVAASADGIPACGHTGYTSIYSPPKGDSLYTPGFQCVELVARFLWVKYGLHPVSGNGAQDAYTYARADHRSLFANGTPHESPQIGDVMSFSNTSNYSDTGHTSIVIANSVNASTGNGDIKTLNEDWGYPIGQGTGAIVTLPVNGWSVSVSAAGGFSYIEWAATGSGSQSLEITTPSTATSPPNATVNQPYRFALSATGGKGGYTWSVAAGSLPPGLSLAANGVISGTAHTVSKPNGFTAEVVSNKQAAEQRFTIWSLTSSKALEITTPNTATSPPNATVGVAYSFKFAATGGTGTYSWSLTKGSLPTGLKLAASGSISGTATSVSKLGPFTVEVSSGGATASSPFTIWALGQAALTITTPSTASSPPNATVGKAYKFTFSASGGNGSYTWSLLSGGLPPGLQLSSAGVISGTPKSVSKGGPFTIEVGSEGQTATKSFTIWALT